MTTIVDTSIGTSRPSIGSIVKAAGMAIAVAVILNAILYFLSDALGWLPLATTFAQEITLVPILIFSIMPIIIGTVIYFILTRFMTHSRANQIFVILSSIVLIIMAITPLTNLANPTFAGVMMLQIMHLVVGLPTMYFLTKNT